MVDILGDQLARLLKLDLDALDALFELFFFEQVALFFYRKILLQQPGDAKPASQRAIHQNQRFILAQKPEQIRPEIQEFGRWRRPVLLGLERLAPRKREELNRANQRREALARVGFDLVQVLGAQRVGLAQHEDDAVAIRL